MGREIKDRGKIDSQVAIERSRSPSGAVSVGNGRGIYRIRARWDDAGEPLRVLLRPAGEKDVNIGRAETLLCREVKENVLSFSQLRVKFETPGRAPLLHNCANADEVCKCCRQYCHIVRIEEVTKELSHRHEPASARRYRGGVR
jgi:hypothetical protein